MCLLHRVQSWPTFFTTTRSRPCLQDILAAVGISEAIPKVQYCDRQRFKNFTLVDQVISTSAQITESWAQAAFYFEYFSFLHTGTMKVFYCNFFFHLTIFILIKQKQCSTLCALCSHPLTPNTPDSLPPPAGVVLLDKNQGFWLVHSTPQFAPVKKAGRFSYPSSGVVNGQNFLCVTYPLERFQAIGKTGGRMRAKVKLGGCCAASFKYQVLSSSIY